MSFLSKVIHNLSTFLSNNLHIFPFYPQLIHIVIHNFFHSPPVIHNNFQQPPTTPKYPHIPHHSPLHTSLTHFTHHHTTFNTFSHNLYPTFIPSLHSLHTLFIFTLLPIPPIQSTHHNIPQTINIITKL